MIGTYRFFDKKGNLLAQSRNTITIEGRKILLKYLSGEIPSWASNIVVGAGNAPTSVSDRSLQAEFGRGSINLSVSNDINSRVVLRGTLSPDISGLISEVGIVLSDSMFSIKPVEGILAKFDPEIETVYGGTIDTTNYRAGSRSLNLITTTVEQQINYPGYAINLLHYADNDQFTLAYFLASGRAIITVDVLQDLNNYFRYSFTSPVASGYHIRNWDKIQFSKIGQPLWSTINELRFGVKSTTGTTSVSLDLFRINDREIYPHQGLISRSVLPNVIPKDSIQELDIEYELTFNFGLDGV